MTNNNIDTQQQSELSVGEQLRIARQKAGLGVAEVAAQMCLLRSAVIAIENDDHTKLRGDTFVRGYIRNYARLLSLDENELLELHGCARKPEKPSHTRRLFARKQPVLTQGVSRASIVLALLGLSVFLLFQNRNPIADTLQPVAVPDVVEIETRKGIRVVPLTAQPTLTDVRED